MSKKPFDESLGSWDAWHDPDARLRLGVSSCLLGEEVRFDGGHAGNRFVIDVLGNWFDWVPVCPEVDVGMGIPRPTIRLEGGKQPRLVSPSTGVDFTESMKRYARGRVRELMAMELDGYILKKGSPSCGMERVRVYGKGGTAPRRDGVGMFAAELLRRWPALPVEEEGRLNDAPIRENFIERVFCRNRWRSLVHRGVTRRRLVAFHTAHKLLLLSHNEAGYRRLGRLVASAGKVADRQLFADYERELQNVMRTRATRKRHVNVLQHAMGYMKKVLSSGEKQEIMRAIDDFGAGLLPLVVPVTLLRFNIRRYQVDYLIGQLYFDPHPKELMLRNHV